MDRRRAHKKAKRRRQKWIGPIPHPWPDDFLVILEWGEKRHKLPIPTALIDESRKDGYTGLQAWMIWKKENAASY